MEGAFDDLGEVTECSQKFGDTEGIDEREQY